MSPLAEVVKVWVLVLLSNKGASLRAHAAPSPNPPPHSSKKGASVGPLAEVGGVGFLSVVIERAPLRGPSARYSSPPPPPSFYREGSFGGSPLAEGGEGVGARRELEVQRRRELRTPHRPPAPGQGVHLPRPSTRTPSPFPAPPIAPLPPPPFPRVPILQHPHGTDPSPARASAHVACQRLASG